MHMRMSQLARTRRQRAPKPEQLPTPARYSCRAPPAPFKPPAHSLMAAALLTPTQRYAAGALLALALRQAQIHQSVLLGSSFPVAVVL